MVKATVYKGMTLLSKEQETCLGLYHKNLLEQHFSQVVEGEGSVNEIQLAAPAASINFIVFKDSPTFLSLKSNEFSYREFNIVLQTPQIDCDLEFDSENRGTILNEDQVSPSDNAIVIKVDSNPSSFRSVAVLANKQRIVRLQLGTAQCFGKRSDGNQCRNRRLCTSSEMDVWCHHHLDLKKQFDDFKSNKNCCNAPEWWK